MSNRPDPSDVSLVLGRIKETSDCVVCTPENGPTRYLWSNGSGVFVQIANRSTRVGPDAVDRYQTMLDWGVEMEWDDLENDGVMDHSDPRYEPVAATKFKSDGER